MRTALDSSVLLDVIIDDPAHADASEVALRRAANEGSLLISECVLAEIRPAFRNGQIDEFISDWNLVFVPSTRETSVLAGEMFAAYLARRAGRRARVLPDFLIGAHAFILGDRLLARDRGYYRDYFKRLVLMEP